MTKLKQERKFRAAGLAKAGAVSALTMGLVAGLAAPAMAADDGYALPTKGDEGRAHIITSVEKPKPGQPVSITASYDNVNIFDLKIFNNGNAKHIEPSQDWFKLFYSWEGAIKVGGNACADLGGSVAVQASGNNGKSTGWFPIDVGNSLKSVINGLGSLFGAGDLISIQTKCDFVVSQDAPSVLPIEYDLKQSNFFGLLKHDTNVYANLPIDVPRAPGVPEIVLPMSNTKITSKGVVKGRVPTGAGYNGLVQLYNYGQPFGDPVKVDKDGFWTAPIPGGTAQGDLWLTARALGQNGNPDSAESRGVKVTLDDSVNTLTQPVISSPAGDTVKPGEELTVTGTEGSQVTAVDQNGKVIGGSAKIKDGKAVIKLNSPLADGTKVKIQALLPNNPDVPAKYSEEKTVQAAVERPEFFQSFAPNVKPGTVSPLDVSFEPKDGNFAKIAGKALVLTAPEGVLFTGDASYQTFDKDKRALNGGGIWLPDAAIGDGGKTLTVTIPAAGDLKTANATIFKVTVVVKTAAGATPGEKANGTAALAGYTSPLKATVGQ
ncbi:hypothetical protein [Amycolatopsis nalaikhensis]|uniref:Uncharacterized protein n=1 Tax=Amycolatopsis nalaikhensis TaxID=715472 RepID=A0ABY8XCT4_9PSEU|nr:hypothetical protein [Amycolatopsis sp. 2-2]WIV52980.1 hypothetical protein QP939_29055 [Amycolatopsis sp. 2-2]